MKVLLINENCWQTDITLEVFFAIFIFLIHTTFSVKNILEIFCYGQHILILWILKVKSNHNVVKYACKTKIRYFRQKHRRLLEIGTKRLLLEVIKLFDDNRKIN